VSSTLDRVDWNAELVREDLGKAVQQLKQESRKGLFVGGVKLPLALAELGLIDEYEFVVQPPSLPLLKSPGRCGLAHYLPCPSSS
jgi:dihydrofolate reductase